MCKYNDAEVVPQTAQKVQSSVLVRLGNFPAFSQSLDSAALPAGEDYFVSEEQQHSWEWRVVVVVVGPQCGW